MLRLKMSDVPDLLLRQVHRDSHLSRHCRIIGNGNEAHLSVSLHFLLGWHCVTGLGC